MTQHNVDVYDTERSRSTSRRDSVAGRQKSSIAVVLVAAVDKITLLHAHPHHAAVAVVSWKVQ